MRVPIAVQIKPFEIDKVQPQIDAARDAFTRYLDEVPRKSTRSKHGLMGPVGKILSEVKSGRRDPASLKGYAVRVHEATSRRPSQRGLEALEAGIECLVRLLADAPVTVHDRVLDRLDYGLYYDLRKKAIESYEAARQTWIEFLRVRYGSEAKVSEAWREQIKLDDQKVPRKAEGSKSKKASPKQQDIAAFWESRGAVVVVEDEEE